jgi:hypothetical protein
MLAPVVVLKVCTCSNAEDEHYNPGHRCCECGAFFILQIPTGSPQRCPCGHVRGTVRVELPKPEARGWARLWKRLEEALGRE